MKEYITALSYQHEDGPGGILNAADRRISSHFPFNLPSEVNMAYNGALGLMKSKSPLIPLTGKTRGRRANNVVPNSVPTADCQEER